MLQADAYSGFGELYRKNRITEAACWAHADKVPMAEALVFDVYRNPGVAAGAKSVALEVRFQPRHRTLTQEELGLTLVRDGDHRLSRVQISPA